MTTTPDFLPVASEPAAAELAPQTRSAQRHAEAETHLTNLRAIEEMEAYIRNAAPGAALSVEGFEEHLASVNIA